jgi:hypothetical protein
LGRRKNNSRGMTRRRVPNAESPAAP